MKTLIELNNIEVKGNKRSRLRNISLSINQGEKVALIGKSGAGKSTLISVANGTILPHIGEVMWKKKIITCRTKTELSRIGTFWQDLRLIEELNVIQNINAGALGRHNFLWAVQNIMGAIERKKCIPIINALNLSESILNKKVNKISGGQKQRVAIARLLRQESELILADEPFSNLDPKTGFDILKLLLKTRKFESLNVADTLLISLHQPELISYFTRVIGLKEGELVLDISTKGLEQEDINWIY